MTGGRGPTVVLVGGPMIVDGGTSLDSRQPVDGDPRSLVSQRALVGSVLWWRSVLSLTVPMLDAAGENAFCYVVGGKSVKELRSDGSLTQRRLTSILSGASASVEFERPLEDHPLPEDFVAHGKIGYRVDTAGVRWVFAKIDQPPYTIASAIGAAVVIDTSRWAYETSSGRDHYESFEQARIYDDAVVILPHTARIEAFLHGYVEWVHSGRQKSAPLLRPVTRTDPERPQNLLDAVPVPLTADFGVTGVLQGLEWVDPADMEAARSLLQSRYDLKIGLWDLVGNPTLRRTLLDSTPVIGAPEEHVAIPAAAAARAAKKVETFAAEVAERTLSKDAIFLMLEPHGWERGHCPLETWHGRIDDRDLLYMTLSITKRRTAITVATVGGEWTAVRPYLQEHCDELEAIASPDLCQVREGKTTLWRTEGGWSDPVDWDERVAGIVARTDRWKDVFVDLGAHYRQLQAAAEELQIAEYVELGFPEEHWRTSR